MSEASETHADIIAGMRGNPFYNPHDIAPLCEANKAVSNLADRLDAAHKRELAAKDATIQSLNAELQKARDVPDYHRFNAGKLGVPFYVDVGTSIVAIRCTSNDDVLWRADFIYCGKWQIDEAKRICARMNEEAKRPIGNIAALRESPMAARDPILPQCNGGTSFAKAGKGIQHDDPDDDEFECDLFVRKEGGAV